MTIVRKKISEYELSPCIICLVKVTCTRNLDDKSVCKDYVDFVVAEVERCLDESKDRLRNK